MKGYRHLTETDRIKMETLLTVKSSFRVIAQTLHCSLSTVYREYHRGCYTRIDTQYRFFTAYSADIAQKEHNYRATNKGAPAKVKNDFAFIRYVEQKITNEHYSPAAVIADIRSKRIPFQTTVCTKTLYNYINSNIFFTLSNDKLLQNPRIKRDYNKINRHRIKKPLCRSIEERMEDIIARSEFGHWEMDTVVGKAKGRGQALLVLTERKSRYEIIRKMRRHTLAETCRILDDLERQYKKAFPSIFKTITVDNGSEFLNAKKLEESQFSDDKRTILFYCHPYSSWERGSNENANRLIRRFIPKGTLLEKYSTKEIQDIQDWMNGYPRKILGWKCAADLFHEEVLSL